MQREMAVMFDVEDDAQFGRACEVLAEALVHVNMAQLQSDATLPCCLGCGGVQYVPPQACPLPESSAPTRGIRPRRRRPVLHRAQCQAVYDARGIYRHKRGTCFDLACERAARIRLKGDAARVVVEQRTYQGQPLGGQYHAYVKTLRGIQDPAAELQRSPGQCAGSCGCGNARGRRKGH